MVRQARNRFQINNRLIGKRLSECRLATPTPKHEYWK